MFWTQGLSVRFHSYNLYISWAQWQIHDLPEGCANPGGRGYQPIYWSNFQKVANMKKIVPGVRPKLVYVDPSLIALTLQNRKQCLVFLAQYIKFKRPLIVYRISRKVDCVEQFVRKCDNKPLGKIEEWRKGCKDIE